MLTVAKVTGQMAAGYADYLEGKTQAPALGDYYLKNGERAEAPGRWVRDDRHELLLGLTEFDATFTDRDARAVALERYAGVPIGQALAALSQAREERAVIRLVDGSSTTSWHRALERSTVATFDELARERLRAIPGRLVEDAAQTVNQRLSPHGGRLSPEQRSALELACGDRQVVMIEGHAGTGKSTLLQAVALAHQADGQQVIVTSTAAIAAERLASDLAAVGVHAPAYSTVALRHAIDTGRLDIGARTTVIHDEAALASTREQQHLLEAVQERWAHLIIVGDPQQSKPVGAILTDDYFFQSPSAAAGVMLGRSANGRQEWKDAAGTPLKVIQSQGL